MGKNKKRKKLPPEELYNTPDEYFQGEVLYDYTHSKSLMRIQEKITKRALEIIDAEPPALILDVGAGAGFSSAYLFLNNYEVVAIDLLYKMLTAYDIREFNPVNSRMESLPLKENSFDYIISVSAFQWIINKLEKEERDKVLGEIALSFKRILKPNGKAIIQFYPVREELLKEVGAVFADIGGFNGNFLIDNPEGGPKKKIFLYLEN